MAINGILLSFMGCFSYCYLELLDKLQKLPLAYCRNVANLSLLCRYYSGRCLIELAQLVPLPYSRGRSTCYSAYLMLFFDL